MLITLDSGTTNTRMKLISDEGRKIAEFKLSVGVRDTAITGSTAKLKEGIKKGLKELLSSAHISENDISCIAASGMISSNMGLYELPHIITPANVKRFSDNTKKAYFNDITSIPFFIIPGIKNAGDYTKIENLDSIDMMRGEEVEAIGIMDILNVHGPIIMVLPGSHTKIVEINERDEITKCHTTLGGEIISAVSSNTILNSSLPEGLIKEIDPEFLIMGSDYSKNHGFNGACFKVRIMEQFNMVGNQQVANFFVGAVLNDDVTMIMSIIENCNNNAKIIVGGPEPLRQAFYKLLSKNVKGGNEIIELPGEAAEMSTSRGAFRVCKGVLI